MTDVVDPFAEDPVEDSTAPAWQPRPWWAWSGGLLAAGLVLVLLAAARLSDGSLGTSLRPRGCDGDVAGALVLLAVGAVLAALGMSLARLHHPASILSWDLRSLPLTVPVPLFLVLGAAPGVLGCRSARDVAALPLAGEALVGAPGILTLGLGIALLAAALGAAANVAWIAPEPGRAEEQPGIVELAIEEAEAFRADGAGERFRGVDSTD